MNIDLQDIDYEKRGDKLHMDCPYCPSRGMTPDTGLHLALSVKQGWWKCVRCGAGGRSPVGAVLAAKGAGEATEAVPPAPRTIPGYRAFLDDPGCVGARAGIAYLKKRRVGTTRAIRLSLGFSTDVPYSVIFPVAEPGGAQPVFYVLRRYYLTDPEHDSPYLFPSRADGWPGASEMLYTPDPPAEGDPVVLVEGVFDAIHCPFGVGMFGHSLSEVQARKICAMKPAAIFNMVDSDVSGWERQMIRRCLRAAGWCGRLVDVVPPPNKDPADLGTARCARLIEEIGREELGDGFIW